MDFITSDIHFSHKNIMKFCPVSRAFGEDDVDKMEMFGIIKFIG